MKDTGSSPNGRAPEMRCAPRDGARAAGFFLAMGNRTTKQLAGAAEERCVYCSSTRIIRKGTRRKKFETVQLWYCKTCDQIFSPQLTRGKTYPAKIIIEGLAHYHRGHSLEESSRLLRHRFGIRVATKTLSRWLDEYRDLCAYGRLREAGMELFSPHQVIQQTRLYHRQVYDYRVHRAKLELLGRKLDRTASRSLRAFLISMADECPHRLFTEGGRGSKLDGTFDLGGVRIARKENVALRMTRLALEAASRNRQRHDAVQRFMIANDSATVATEVPVYLLPRDIAHFKRRLRFDVPLPDDAPVTGHIDVLQIRNRAIHILDFKPNAGREKPIGQLTFYALALSRRTGLRLLDFKCAWFDENHYFEFYPLQVVAKKQKPA